MHCYRAKENNIKFNRSELEVDRIVGYINVRVVWLVGCSSPCALNLAWSERMFVISL
jgi:hypothetical protein